MNCVSRNINDSVLSIETGEMAKQADGAVVIRFGDSILLVTAVAEHKQSNKDFFPLYVEYR